MIFHTIAVFAAQAAALLAALSVAGYPLAVLFERIAGHGRRIICLPLLGLYPIAEFSWLWSRYSHSGLHLVLPILLLVCAIFDVVLLAIRRPRLTNLVHKAWPAVAISLALFVIYIVFYRAFFHLDYQTPATLKNFDAPYLATLSEHLRIGGFNDLGHVFGADIGHYVKRDTFGTFVLDALPAIVLHKPVWETSNSTFFAAWVILAVQVFTFLRRGLLIRTAISTFGAIVTVVSPLVFFVLGNDYLSELIGASLLVAGLTVFLRLRRSRDSLTAGILQLACITAILWHVYPFAAVVLPVLSVPIVMVTHLTRKKISFLFWLIGVTVAQWMLSAILASGRFPDAIHQATVQSAAKAGWTLPAFSPSQILGFAGGFTHFSNQRWIASVFVMVLVAALLVFLRTQRLARICAALFVVGFGSYVLMYMRSGVSYQQWKWASLLAPLLVAGLVALLASAAEVIVCVARRERSANTLVKPTAGTAIAVSVFPKVASMASLLVLLVVFSINVSRLTHSSFRLGSSDTYITPDLASVAGSSAMRSATDVTLQTSVWEAMWTTAFFPSVNMYHVSFYGYFPVERLVDGPNLVLERFDDATPPSQVDQKQLINKTYSLIKLLPSKEAAIEVENYTHNPASGQPISWQVKVINLGTTPWYSSQDHPSSGTSLRVLLVGSTQIVVDNVDTQSLPEGTVVSPGESYVFSGTVLQPQHRPCTLQFDVVQATAGPIHIWTRPTLAPVSSKSPSN